MDNKTKQSEKITVKQVKPPAWVLGEIEAPKGEKNMGTWTASVYTSEQQKRLNIDETGKKKDKK